MYINYIIELFVRIVDILLDNRNKRLQQRLFYVGSYFSTNDQYSS